MKRNFTQILQNWHKLADRKPLIIKGVRQCGKTYILKEFGANNFPACHYINFEGNQTLVDIFAENLDPHKIIEQLSFKLNKNINIGTDLVVFDEIQACPQAITSLKYFCENMPSLALCCAGSLLGIHLNEVSFPVGKVNLANMKPLTFCEFLAALGEDKSLEYMLDNINNDKEIPQVVHKHLWEKLTWYFVTGGLPEVVVTFNKYRDNLFDAFNRVREKQKDLVLAYYADMAKHSGKVNAMHLDRVWREIPAQLARLQDDGAAKFKFKGVIPGNNRYSNIANVIDWLLAAELIIKVPIVETVEFPLAAYTQDNKFKLYMFDIGLLGAMSDLSPKIILEQKYGTYKGYFAENFVAEELIAQQHKLYSWQRSRAKIEFVLAVEDKILPVEVKAGTITKNKSLKSFMEKYDPECAVVLSGREYCFDKVSRIRYLPLYLCSRIQKTGV